MLKCPFDGPFTALKCPFDGPFTALKCPFQMAPCPFENLGRTLVLDYRANKPQPMPSHQGSMRCRKLIPLFDPFRICSNFLSLFMSDGTLQTCLHFLTKTLFYSQRKDRPKSFYCKKIFHFHAELCNLFIYLFLHAYVPFTDWFYGL